MTRKQRRLTFIGVGLSILGLAVGLVLFALRDTIVFFHTPSDIIAKSVEEGTRLRLGGLVGEDSIVKDGEKVSFDVTDGDAVITVSYIGILPDLFREGQGVVTEGILEAGGTFAADTVLAKHDENYMPKEVADALKEKGVWQGQGESKDY